MGTVISLLNMKGGVGKTSSCYHLAGTLARSGLSVLLLDNDPQASLTNGFWGPEALRALDPAESIAALYDPHLGAIPEALVRPTGLDGVAIVPGSEALTSYNITPTAEWGGSERGIAEFLVEVRDAFDLVLIDCPPNLYLCSWAALVASDHIVVPVMCEDFGSQGLAPVERSIRAVRSGPNPSLNLLGYLLTMYDRRLTVHLTYEAVLREMYGNLVFAAPFPRAKDYIEAVAGRRPISHYKPKSAAAKSAKVVADELVARLVAAEDASARAERGAA
jgi:chromosome partitioning protein